MMTTTRFRPGTMTVAAVSLGAALVLGGCALAAGPDRPVASGRPADGTTSAPDVLTATLAGEGARGDGGGCTAQQRWTALATVAPQVRDYLGAHPDVAAEIDHLRGLPQNQRRGEARAYLQDHPEVRGTAEQVRDQVLQYRRSCGVG